MLSAEHEDGCREKTNLAETSHQKIRAIAEKYNNTPRQCLGFWTPNEIFNSVALQP